MNQLINKLAQQLENLISMMNEYHSYINQYNQYISDNTSELKDREFDLSKLIDKADVHPSEIYFCKAEIRFKEDVIKSLKYDIDAYNSEIKKLEDTYNGIKDDLNEKLRQRSVARRNGTYESDESDESDDEKV